MHQNFSYQNCLNYQYISYQEIFSMSSEIDCGNDCPESSTSTQTIRGMNIGKGMQERIKTGKMHFRTISFFSIHLK